jgi:predicted DNA-binding protein
MQSTMEPMYYSMSQKATSVRISPTTAKRLDRLARVIDRPKSQLINKALEEYLEEYEDYLVAIGRLNDKNDRIISGKELRKKIGR